uniref:Prolyl 4-hydroxylase alpha subunit domain-containing protein n=1 Tax=Emiliania huxleyi TaxID=2903 RepID=A0A7S3REA8_EMIHU
MSTLLASDDVGPSMLSIPAFLSPAECAAWVSWGETSGFEQEKHAQTRWIAHRDNGRLAVQSESIAAALWSRLAPLMPAESTRRGAVACGCNPNIRLYRYTPGQRFGQHVDQSNAMPGGEQTEWTMLVYLSGGPGQEVVGGETAFYDGGRRSVVVDPLAGSALLHAHGERCLTHEALEVRRGVKYVLRSDVVFAPSSASPNAGAGAEKGRGGRRAKRRPQ